MVGNKTERRIDIRRRVTISLSLVLLVSILLFSILIDLCESA